MRTVFPFHAGLFQGLPQVHRCVNVLEPGTLLMMQVHPSAGLPSGSAVRNSCSLNFNDPLSFLPPSMIISSIALLLSCPARCILQRGLILYPSLTNTALTLFSRNILSLRQNPSVFKEGFAFRREQAGRTSGRHCRRPGPPRFKRYFFLQFPYFRFFIYGGLETIISPCFQA